MRAIFTPSSKHTSSCVRPRAIRYIFSRSAIRLFISASRQCCLFMLQITAIPFRYFTTYMFLSGNDGPTRTTEGGPLRRNVRLRYHCAFTDHLADRRSGSSDPNAHAEKPAASTAGTPPGRNVIHEKPASEPRRAHRIAPATVTDYRSTGRAVTMLSTTNLVKPRQGRAPKYSR